MTDARERRRRWWSISTLALSLLLLVVVALTLLDRESDDDNKPVMTSRFASMVAGLCETNRLAHTEDVHGANDVFTDRVHDPLHELATETSNRDRSTAARLLEAKERVETLFASEAPGRQLAAALQRLATTTDQALILIAEPAPRCLATGPTR